MSCPRYVKVIKNSQNLGDSLITLNNNFYSLRNTLCSFQERLDNLVNIRTFFYYGPNSGIDPTSGMDNNKTTRPSDNTIQNFVNNELGLNSISKLNDQVYVVYQKTGFLSNKAIQKASGTATARVISFSTQVAWSTEIENRYDVYSPVFIVWKLTLKPFNGVIGNQTFTNAYLIDEGFPKFLQSETFSTTAWHRPDLWNGRF